MEASHVWAIRDRPGMPSASSSGHRDGPKVKLASLVCPLPLPARRSGQADAPSGVSRLTAPPGHGRRQHFTSPTGPGGEHSEAPVSIANGKCSGCQYHALRRCSLELLWLEQETGRCLSTGCGTNGLTYINSRAHASLLRRSVQRQHAAPLGVEPSMPHPPWIVSTKALTKSLEAVT